MENVAVYVSALERALKEKLRIVEKLLVLTTGQEQLLNKKDVEYDSFNAIVEEKAELIEKMNRQDASFDRAYAKIGDTLKDQKETYRDRILQMQELIRRITDVSVKLQATESRNKEKFAAFAVSKRREIRNFNTGSKAVSSYYKSMANRSTTAQDHFLDQAK